MADSPTASADIPEQWRPLLEDLALRQAQALAMGGTERLERLAERGGRDARAWVKLLVDPDSFREIGLLAGSVGDGIEPPRAADGFVAGTARIDGRVVCVGVEDPTVAGGSIGVPGGSKRVRLAMLAAQLHAPLILLLSGAGHRATNPLAPHRPAPHDLQILADLHGVVPVLSVVTGPSAGHGALAAPLSDICVMVRGRGALFSAGPPLVAASIGERVDAQELGGVDVHARESGLVHLVADDAPVAALAVRRVLGYLPGGPVPSTDPAVTAARDLPELLDLIPVDSRRPFDMRPVVQALTDAGSSMELQRDYGVGLLTVLARIGGHAVAIVASQPAVLAGSIDVAAADKATHFIERTGRWGLPLLLLADSPGMLPGSSSERAGILRAGAGFFLAQRRSPVPKIHVTVRKAFGFGSSVFGANPFDHQMRSFAFPGATLGGMPAGVGGATSGADAARREELLAAEGAGPWRFASTGTYDEIIDPRQLRRALIEVLGLPAAAPRAGEPG
ncbi:acetyl-CoA carboxylase carboxyltransferase component [Branchiibius hedensis]|uniref:Acetyl-CoA carboxylase, carboxyltransferase component n=1 Tax=Branchiibius hedensis TaxID=672460 RepID=A0A2Y9A028_9MICO|nr:carboxyl transferase domain-containing protein [Branchiibius hedensis]PWJ27058.1 acetyl-CoA carboxylase carboxyltransferase component [Branchiibius hedensis]SSA35869.1 Acetyl-CoA carboxylase, carboxyltransferase component [Branchiibius hedensis]